MSITQFAKPLETKVAACEAKEESWKLDHELAMAALNLQDLLNDVIECYDEMQQFDHYVFSQLREGKAEYDDELNNMLISLCERIHRLLEAIDAGLLPWFEARFGSIDHALEFRERLSRARESKKFGYRRNAHLQNQISADHLWNLINSGS